MKLVGFVALGLLASCAPNFREAARVLGNELPERTEPVLDRRRSYFANDLTRPHRDWFVLLYPDGRVLEHGRDTSWYASGQLEWEREYDHGEATGHWRAWYEDGTPRSEQTFGSAELTPVRWWYPNGQLSSEGPALSGVRDGEWTQWHSNGNKSARGNYRLGKREGPWTFWNEDGSLKETVEYRDDLRVGPAQQPEAASSQSP